MTKTNVIKNALRAIEDAKGRLTPSLVVASATPEDSPLHDQFEWNDSIAGHKWRLDQARELIKSVSVLFRTEYSTLSVVAYVRDPAMPSNVQGYRHITHIREEPDEARDALVKAFSDVANLLRRARDLGVALELSSEIEELLERVAGLDARVRQTANA